MIPLALPDSQPDPQRREQLDLVSEGLCTVTEASRFLKIGRTKVYEHVKSGRLASVKIDRSRRIPLKALREFAARNLHLPGPPGENP